MGLFDKLFDNSGNGSKETAVDKAAKAAVDLIGNPVSEKFEKTFNETAELITESLEAIKNGEEVPEKPQRDYATSGLPDFDSLSKKWDGMINDIEDQELNKYKICPECGEAVPSENNFCPNCGAKLPELTAARRICPYCGAINRTLNHTCVKCGKEIPLIPEAAKKEA